MLNELFIEPLFAIIMKNCINFAEAPSKIYSISIEILVLTPSSGLCCTKFYFFFSKF